MNRPAFDEAPEHDDGDLLIGLRQAQQRGQAVAGLAR